jgi:glycine cleavage system aminomethyltransferase T
VLANRMPKTDGGIVLAHFLSAEGRIAGEATVTRLGQDRFYLLSGAGAEERDLDHLTQQVGDGEAVDIANVTDQRGVLVVAGPRARDLLAGLTDADLGNETFRWLRGKEIEVAGVPVYALRVNYVGELGWELHCPMDRLEALYDALWAAGQAHGIADFGIYAVNSLRMEKAYKGWAAELTNEITLIEADMERFVGFDKEDFVGKAATLRVKQAGVSTVCVYFECEMGTSDVHGGEAVLVGDRAVGVTTSGGYGHTTGKSLGFAYVEPELAAPGSSFDVYPWRRSRLQQRAAFALGQRFGADDLGDGPTGAGIFQAAARENLPVGAGTDGLPALARFLGCRVDQPGDNIALFDRLPQRHAIGEDAGIRRLHHLAGGQRRRLAERWCQGLRRPGDEAAAL